MHNKSKSKGQPLHTQASPSSLPFPSALYSTTSASDDVPYLHKQPVQSLHGRQFPFHHARLPALVDHYRCCSYRVLLACAAYDVAPVPARYRPDQISQALPSLTASLQDPCYHHVPLYPQDDPVLLIIARISSS